MRIIAIAALTLLMTTGVALADKWTGLYQSIDHLDGSVDTLSIVDLGDGSYRIVLSSTGLGLCPDNVPGSVTSVGRPEGNSLYRENVQFRCGNGPLQKTSEGFYLLNEEKGFLSTKTPIGHTLYFHRLHP